MQGLHDKFKDKGLVIMAPHVQSADRDTLEVFMLKHGMTYPVALSADTSQYPGRGIPRAAIIGTDGTIVWQGHPGGGKVDKIIETELKKVDLYGERGLLRTHKSVAKNIYRKKLGAALKALKAAAAKGTPTVDVNNALTRLEKHGKGLIAKARAAQEVGDLMGALGICARAKKLYKGSDIEKEAIVVTSTNAESHAKSRVDRDQVCDR